MLDIKFDGVLYPVLHFKVTGITFRGSNSCFHFLIRGQLFKKKISYYSFIILPAGSTLFENGKLPQNCSVAAFIPKLICSAGVWGCWSELSSCSVSCGEGVYSRTRQCQSLPPGKPFTIPCDGPAEETVPCNTGPCISKMLIYTK